MSVRDLPDWTRQVTIRYEGGFIGLEELSARLGSIVPWDLKGNIVLLEDFESELTEWTDGSESPCEAVRSSRHKFSGDWSLNLHNPINSPTLPAVLSRYFHFPGTTKYAAFYRFSGFQSTTYRWFKISLDDGTTKYTAEVDYPTNGNILSVVTTGGAYHNVDTAPPIGAGTFTWYPVLVTFDFATGYYDKLYFADKEYDISDVPLYSETTEGAPIGYVEVGAITETEGDISHYVDDILIAKNVP